MEAEISVKIYNDGVEIGSVTVEDKGLVLLHVKDYVSIDDFDKFFDELKEITKGVLESSQKKGETA